MPASKPPTHNRKPLKPNGKPPFRNRFLQKHLQKLLQPASCKNLQKTIPNPLQNATLRKTNSYQLLFQH
jgi:hypothetical protein